MNGIANIWIWVGFSLFLVIALGIDSYVVNKPKYDARHSMRNAIFWTLVWIFSALIFNLILWLYLKHTTTPAIANEHALDFLTGYIIEKSLSTDNLFVFYLIFTQFSIPEQYQKRILSYGIWSAIIMRLLLILVGSWLVTNFHWFLYVMGAFLLAVGVEMMFSGNASKDLSSSSIYLFLKKHLRVTDQFHGKNFFIRKNKLLYATPLFIALVFIEISDIVFASESIPAIFAITTDPFIVWTSNIFAILGLRALYFLLAGAIARFSLLKYAIAMILVFIGFKMLIAFRIVIPVSVSLAVILGILLLFFMIYLYQNKTNNRPISK